MRGVIERPPLPAGPVLVVGLARSGVAAALALRERGLAVTGCDAGPVAADARARLEGAGVAVHERTEGIELLAGAETLVKSPGVPQEAAVVALAHRTGRRVVGELEIGWRLLGNEFLAVTGSNGKTTTVELLGHVHRTAGVPVVVAGNVGTPIASLPGTLDPGTVVVCEASSFQLEDTEAFAPEAAVLLNVVEDHLDRHGDLAAYRRAKLEAFARQPDSALAVLPVAMAGDDDIGGAARRVTFGPGGDLEAVTAGVLTAAGAGAAGADVAGSDPSPHTELRWRGEPLMAAEELRLPGAHNLQNAMAVAALALARGLPADAVRQALATFEGLRHRQETVATVGGVAYVNDSKATNVAAALGAIESYAGGLHLILGGRGKGADYAPLAAPVAARATAVYLIGETAAELRATLEPTGVTLHDSGDLEHAVVAARAAAAPGEVVLLSPACASYDQYRSFEERGDHFRALATREGLTPAR
jgi:UDP-N-acetylmuramoylalanine--D-glutamate ligase